MIETSVARQNALNLPHDSLLGDYPVADSGYDEMCSSPGTLRPHWRDLMQFLDETGGEELERRHSEVQRLLQEDGVTYNAYDDSRNAQRHWLVDPIPLLMTGEEWSDLAAGMEQRSRLLNALMTDLYGPRTAIRQGWLPPELIYAYPGFLHACHQSLPNGSRWLIFHGVDLARGPDGVFRVYGDRSQSPSGAGYTLENRIILARALPMLYRDAPLRRLASFLETERATLAGLARHNPEDPHVVLLTPGPNSPVYFEHAYLANYLSLSLVEGEDLVVRDGRVWLKTLGGLRPVDVILRLVFDAYCDPLELRGDSLLGIPGLLQAARGGHVAIANAIGSGSRRKSWTGGFPASAMPAVVRRDAEAAVTADLVVRRFRGARLCVEPSGSVSDSFDPAWSTPLGSRPTGRGGPCSTGDSDPGRPPPVRRPGITPAVYRAGAGRRTLDAATGDAAWFHGC
jgi:uncharacterized circularly permuted ATP-grasp superfamily protein